MYNLPMRKEEPFKGISVLSSSHKYRNISKNKNFTKALERHENFMWIKK